MIGPAYTIPTLTRMAESELSRYVKGEFNDRDCHWFTCGNGAVGNGKRTRPTKSPLLRRLLWPNRRRTPERAPTIVPCAVILVKGVESDQCCSTADK